MVGGPVDEARRQVEAQQPGVLPGVRIDFDPATLGAQAASLRHRGQAARAPGPARDAEAHLARRREGGLHRDRSVGPRVAAGDLDAVGAEGGRAVRVEQDAERAVGGACDLASGVVEVGAHHVVRAALVERHAGLRGRGEVARAVRADDVRAPAPVARDAGEEGVEERLLDEVRIAGIAREEQQLAVEADPVDDVAELRHAVHARGGVEEVVEVAGASHRVELFPDEAPVPREHGVEGAPVARGAVVFDEPFEAAQDFVGLGPEGRERIPRVDRLRAEGVADQRRGRGGNVRGGVHRADDVAGERKVAVRPREAVQFQQRAQDAHGRNAVPRAGLVERQAEAAELRDQMVGHPHGGGEAFAVAGRLVQLDQRPERVLAAPDVEAPVRAGVGILRVVPEEILARVGGEVAVGLLEFGDELVRPGEDPATQFGVARVGDGAGEAEHRLSPVFVLPAGTVGVRVVPVRAEGVHALVVHRAARPVRIGAGEEAGVRRRARAAAKAHVAGGGGGEGIGVHGFVFAAGRVRAYRQRRPLKGWTGPPSSSSTGYGPRPMSAGT